MSNEDKVAEEMANLVLDAYNYSLDKNLDITNREDVMKALTALRPENYKDINVDVLIQGLVALDRMTKSEQAKRQQPS